MKKIMTLCLAVGLMAGLAVNASAADYEFSTGDSTEYYGSTNYEDQYDSAYRYGETNQIDFDIPEIEYGLAQEFLESSLSNPYLTPGTQYGLPEAALGTRKSIPEMATSPAAAQLRLSISPRLPWRSCFSLMAAWVPSRLAALACMPRSMKVPPALPWPRARTLCWQRLAGPEMWRCSATIEAAAWTILLN